MFDHILVPLDSSPVAECVLPHLSAVAQAFKARITLLHVVENSYSQSDSRPVDPLDWEMKRSEAQAYLEEIHDRLQPLNVTVEIALVEGSAAEAIVEYGRKNQVDLIIISSHGQSGFTGWNVSSTVQKVILRSYTSILIVRAYDAPASGGTDFRYSRIVVPLDGSQRAEWVLSFAHKLAASTTAHIELLHVLTPPQMPRQTPPTQEDLELSRRLVERNRQEIESYLEQLCARLNNNLSTRMLSGKEVIPALHEYIEEEHADLVVLSAHGYSENTRWPYGSVTTSFIFYGATPLLIVQDVPADQMKPSPAEIAAQEYKGH